MKFLIVGRTASGKDTLREVLEQKYGWTFVKSYTTRQKRSPNEDTHVFVSKEYADSVSDKVAVTHFDNGNGLDEYFATREQVEAADAYIVDPNGFRQVVNSMGHEVTFVLVYVCPKNKLIQMWHACKRNWRHVGSVLPRMRYESDEFDKFEAYLGRILSLNIPQVEVLPFVRLVNSYKPGDVENFAKLLNDIKLHDLS